MRWGSLPAQEQLLPEGHPGGPVLTPDCLPVGLVTHQLAARSWHCQSLDDTGLVLYACSCTGRQHPRACESNGLCASSLECVVETN